MERRNCLIQRKRLMELANRMQASRILYVQAPAGYGKTVFSGQWLETKAQPRAMLTLDEYDNTVFDFCHKLRALLETLYPQSAPVLAFTKHPGFDSAPEEFLMRAAGSVPQTSAASIVIDDYHNISDPSVQKLLPVFLMRLPAEVQILILSRSAPPEAFSSLILKEQLRTITQEHLRFTSEEIYLLYRSNGTEITKEQAGAIFRYTEGWPIEVGTLLMSGVNILKKSMTPVQLEAFLKTQVWETWDEQSRRFMVATSIEEELTADLCNRLTGLNNSGEMLEKLLSKGSFLVKLQSRAYRFHKLFRELLQKLFEACPGEYQKNQYRLAGSYYLEQKDFYRAIERFSQIGDSDRIAHCFDLLEHIERSGFDTERVMQAVREHVDEDTAGSYPFLFFMLAFTARNEGRIDDFKRFADKYYENQPRVARQSPERTHNIFFLYAMDFRYSLEDIAGIAAGQSAGGKFQVLCGSAASYFPLYHRSFRDFSELALHDIDEGAASMDRLLGPLLGPERPMLIECIRAGLYYERGKLSQAKELALAAVSKIQKGFMSKSNFCALILLLVTEYALEQQKEAFAVEKEIQAMIESDKLFFLQSNFDAVLTKQRLSTGDAQAAQAWLGANDTELCTRVEFFRLYLAFTTARAHITAGSFDKAVILLQKINDLCAAMNRPLDRIEAEMLLAVCYWKKKRGYQKTALRHLENAVEAAQPFGFEQVFVNDGAELESMLSHLKNRTVRGDYQGPLSGPFVKRLYLRAAQQASHSRGLTGGRVENGVRFTQQQKRVMRLLCQGYSYRKIGESLGIQFSTVRSHIELIYKKLDVSGAKEAVLRIQELHVLDGESNDA